MSAVTAGNAPRENRISSIVEGEPSRAAVHAVCGQIEQDCADRRARARVGRVSDIKTGTG